MKSQNEGVTCMFWGFFSKRELGPLVPIKGILNSQEYLKLLKEYLIPILNKTDRKLTFMHDNAPIHTAKVVKEFFAENGIEPMIWPPQSPDLNPIENLWADLKRNRQKKIGPPNSKQELIAQMTSLWLEISEEKRQKLSRSLPKRIFEVEQNNGYHTSY